jgi:diguanylate cyclase (GGDEF)-like protein
MPFIRLRTKLFIGALGITVFLGSLLITFIETSVPKKLEIELQKRGVILAEDIARESVSYLLSENIFNMELFLHQHKNVEEDTEYIFVLDREGKILAHTFGKTFPVDLKGINIVIPEQKYNIKHINTGKGRILDIAVPILEGELGVLRLGISAKPILESINNITRMVGYIIIGVLIFVGSMTAILATVITKPILELTNSAKKIGSGNFQYMVNIKSNDEIGQLARAFNQMARDLETATVKRDELVKEITKRKKLEEKLHALTLTDELTGIFNRRGFSTLANQQLKIANRMKRGVLLLYADVDSLKLINDEFGHKEGDLILVKTANLLKEVFRESDIIARIGGDEFVVFSIETMDSSVETLRARLEKSIENYNTIRNHIFRLSISIGIMYYKQEFSYSLDELLAQADKMMYEQKRHKLNRSVLNT